MSLTRSAVVYARISKDEGQTQAGVERQVKDAIDWINSTPDVMLNAEIDGAPIDRQHPERGHWPPGVLVDDDTKATAKKRPEYNRMMAYAKGGDIQLIVSSEQDRVWRDIEQFAIGFPELRDLAIKLLFLKTGVELDLEDEFTQVMCGIMVLLANWFIRNIAAKQRLAIREAAQAGAYHGARPFGFTLAHLNDPGNPGAGTHEPLRVDAGDRVKCPGCGGRASNKARTILPDPGEAEAVRQAYELVNAGVTRYAVCQYLDGYEIDGPDGTRLSRPAIRTAEGHRWEDVGVQGLLVVLRAKRNIGVREWSAKWDGGKRPPGTLIKGNWEGIVDEPLFDAVQKRLTDGRKVRPGGSEPAHLLTGFTYGGFCGHRLRIHKVNGKRRYACGAWKSDGQCVSFEAEPAELEVERYLYKWLAKNTMLTKQLEHTGNADLTKLYNRRKTLIEQREDLENKDSDNHWGEGSEAVATFKRLKARKDDQIAEVNGEIDVLLDSGAASPRDRKAFPTGAGFRTEWGNADLEGKRVIIRRFIDKVIIYPAGAGNKPDPRLVHIQPGSWWARGIESAQPSPAPDPASFTSKGQILAFLREHPGEWFTREAISTGTGVSLTATAKVLTVLGASGDAAREWRRRGGQRACYMYSAGSGESWGPRTRPGVAAPGAREKVRVWMETPPRDKQWFTAAEIGEGSGAGGAPHVTKTLNELIAAGFAQRRRAPLPRKDVRYQYSVNGR